MVNDTRDMERRLQDKNEINILFSIQKVYQKEIIESIGLIKGQQSNSKVNFYVKINTSGGTTQSNYRIYVGRKLVAILNLTR
jgi:ATP-dependent protease ClpP protease subunit